MTMGADRSAENTALVRKLYEDFGRGDIAGVLDALSPDVEWGEPDNPFNPCAGTWHGHEGFLTWAGIGKESEEILSLVPQQILAQDDTVAVIGHTTCRARRTGRTYQTDFVHLVQVEAGKVRRFREFFDTFAAAEAFRP
jgi:hypothetical protein